MADEAPLLPHTGTDPPTPASSRGSLQQARDPAAAPKRYCFGKLSRRGAVGLGASAALLTLTVVLVGLYVAAPSLAKSELANAQISFVSVNLTDPHPADSYLESIATVEISHVSPMSGTLEALTASVAMGGVKFGELDLPAVSLTAGQTTRFTTATQFRISDLDAWYAVAEAILMEDSVTWSLSGSATVKSTFLGISMTVSDVPMDKEVVLQGAGGLGDVTLLVFDMSESTADEVVVEMTVEVYNPSVVNICPAGDLEFEIHYAGAAMGVLHASDASLYAGDSTLRMSGVMESQNMTALNTLVSRYLSDVPTDVTAVGTANASSIALYNPALVGLPLTTTLMGTPSPLLTDLEVQSMAVSVASEDAGGVGVDMEAAVGFDNPLGPESPILVQTVAMEADVLGNGAVVGRLSTSPGPIEAQTDTELVLAESAVVEFYDDGEAFGAFMAAFVNDDAVQLSLSGQAATDAVCALGNVSLTVPLALNASLTGMSGLPNVTLASFDVPADDPAGGESITVNAVLENPTVGSLTVPTLEAAMATADGTVLGALAGSDVALAPGANALSLSGAVNPGPDALDAAGAFFTSYLQGADQPVRMLGTGAGADAPLWLTLAVEAMDISTTFPGYADPLGLLTDMVVNSMSMDLTVDPPLVSGDVNATVVFPAEFGFATAAGSTLSLASAPALSFDLADPDSGAALGSVALADVPLLYTASTGAIQFTFESVAMTVADEAGLAAVLSDLLNTASATVLFSGDATMVMESNMGELTVGPIPFEQTVTLPACDSFSDPPIGVGSLDVLGDTGDGSLALTSTMTIVNPSPLGGNFGPVTLTLTSADGVALASAYVAAFVVEPAGTFELSADVTYTTPPDDVAAGTAFFGAFVSRADQAIGVVGSADSSAIALLQPAVAAFSVATTLPGMDEDLLTGAEMSLALFSLELPTKLVVNNPFSVDMDIVGADVDITFCTSVGSSGDCDKWGDTIGYYTKDDLAADPVSIPAQSSGYETGKRHAEILLSWDDFQAIWDSLFSGALCKTSGTITIQIGTFSTDVSPFDQEHLMVSL